MAEHVLYLVEPTHHPGAQVHLDRGDGRPICLEYSPSDASHVTGHTLSVTCMHCFKLMKKARTVDRLEALCQERMETTGERLEAAARIRYYKQNPVHHLDAGKTTICGIAFTPSTRLWDGSEGQRVCRNCLIVAQRKAQRKAFGCDEDD